MATVKNKHTMGFFRVSRTKWSCYQENDVTATEALSKVCVQHLNFTCGKTKQKKINKRIKRSIIKIMLVDIYF